MATLKDLTTQTEHLLKCEHRIGRGRGADLQLSSTLVSGDHAIIRWRGDGWTIRDLNATNGTFLNGKQLDSSKHVNIQTGDKLAFGDPSKVFEFTDDDPPEAIAYAPEGRVIHAHEGYLTLPDPERGTLSVYREEIGRWYVDTHDGVRRLAHDGEEFQLEGETWRLELPMVLEKTRRPNHSAERHLSDIQEMIFTVSPDEEHVEIELMFPDQLERLRPRAHHYLLLVLARRRIADQRAPDLPDREHGWIDLEELLALRSNRQTNHGSLNLAIHRARQQLREEHRVVDAAGLIERRRGSKVRIGVSKLKIR
ncbi:MAG: FHA domain-containing protein [Haliangiales bacterium]